KDSFRGRPVRCLADRSEIGLATQSPDDPRSQRVVRTGDEKELLFHFRRVKVQAGHQTDRGRQGPENQELGVSPTLQWTAVDWRGTDRWSGTGREFRIVRVVGGRGIEPLTSALRGFRSCVGSGGAVLGGSQAVAGMTTGITTLLGACRFRAPSRTPERLTRQGQRCATLE